MLNLPRLALALDEVERRLARNSLVAFSRRTIRMDPALHHRYLEERLEEVEQGKIKRLAIFMPPGSAKSTYASQLFPAWYLGKHPQHKLIGASHSEDLAEDFGRVVRNHCQSEDYATIFPGNIVADDNKAARKWATGRGGGYYGVGVGGSVTGRRADGGILDDMIKGRKEADSKTVRDSTWSWYVADFRSRLKPKAWLILIMTRWHQDDPAGRIFPKNWNHQSGWVKANDGEMWFVVNLPAQAEDDDVLGRKKGEFLWEEWFTRAGWEQTRETAERRNWNSLYQQRPTDEEGGIIKRDDWKKWPSEIPPECFYKIQSYDTAYEEGEESDYTARTTWGLFMKAGPDGVDRTNMILLERLKKRMSFPELREEAYRSYLEYQPHRVLIEKKASGASLIQELRRKQVPIRTWVPDRIGKKLARTHAASVVFQQGLVWHMDRRWADEVIDECAAFPTGAHDDLHDCVTQACIWVRKLFHLRLTDEKDDHFEVRKAPQRVLYG